MQPLNPCNLVSHRAGVPGPQQHGSTGARAVPGTAVINERPQRVMAKPALERRRRPLLVRMRCDQGGVDIDDQRAVLDRGPGQRQAWSRAPARAPLIARAPRPRPRPADRLSATPSDPTPPGRTRRVRRATARCRRQSPPIASATARSSTTFAGSCTAAAAATARARDRAWARPCARSRSTTPPRPATPPTRRRRSRTTRDASLYASPAECLSARSDVVSTTNIKPC